MTTTTDRLLEPIRQDSRQVRCEQCIYWRPIPGSGPEKRCANTFAPYHDTQTQPRFWCDRASPSTH